MPAPRAASTRLPARSTSAADARTVVMGEFEFPTMAQIWLAQQRRGARHRVGARVAATACRSRPTRRVIDDSTLIVPATHVCFSNGHKTDIAALTALCHDRGALVFMDDYQHTGSAPLDVHALGVDFMVTGCLKYLLAAAGVGVPVCAARADRAARTDDHRLVRPHQSVRVQDRRARLAGRGPAVRERHAARAERLCGAGGSATLGQRGLRAHRRADQRAWSIASTPPRPMRVSSFARRRLRHSGVRWSWCKASTPRRWSNAWPGAASSPRRAATGCAFRSTPTTTNADVDAVIAALTANADLVERSMART